jgi:sulfite reductase (ferredoxin)
MSESAEEIKLRSHNLRGSIAESLDAGGTRFNESDVQLLKFHGSYQQEDRDARAERKKAGLEPAYQFMLRTRVPGGVLSAEQYLVEDSLADRFGNGTLRITTRQGLQLHGILKGNLRSTIREIATSLLSTVAACGDVNRNVMACPAPPRTAAEIAVQELAQRLAVHFTPRTRAYHEIWIDGEKVEAPEIDEEPPDPIYGRTYLPRKFKMGVSLPGDNCIDVYTQDIGFVAVLDGGALVGYTVLAGGGLGMTHGKATTYPRAATPLCLITPDDAIAVAEAIITTQRDFGDRTNRKHARLKYVVEERGIDWLRAEVEQRLGRSLEGPREVEFHDVADHLGWQEQADGRWALGVYVENGRVKDSERARVRSGLRHVIERFKPSLRLTAQQNIMLFDFDARSRGIVTRLLRDDGIETEAQALGVRRYAMACPAIPTCGLAVADAERVLPDIIDDIACVLDDLGLAKERLSVRMTGCPNGCARPYMGDVGFVGRSKDLYDIYLGGDWANTRLNWVYKTSVRRTELVNELRPLLRSWRDQRRGGETFGDFCTRIGRERLEQTVEVLA